MSSPAPVAIVTGASRGIGRATAQRLARAGYRLTLVARDSAALRMSAHQLGRPTEACCEIAVDLLSFGATMQIVDRTLERFGRIDALINNAGIAPLADIASMSDAGFNSCLGLNVRTVFELTRAAWPAMLRQRGGVIVNVSSMASVDPFPGFAVYGACKAWVNLFTKAAASEGAPHGIRVYAVAPGAVETRMLREHFPDFPAAETLSPEDVAAAIERCILSRSAPDSGATIFVQKQ